jgi:hypothetical protein
MSLLAAASDVVEIGFGPGDELGDARRAKMDS